MTAWAAALLHNPYVIFAGWTLFVVLWGTTAVGIVFAILRACAPARTVARDYAMALGSFALAIAVVPMTLAWQVWITPQFGALMVRHQTVAGNAGTTTAVLRGLLQRPVMDGIAAGVAAIWVVGTCALLVRLIGGWCLTRSVVAKAAPIEDDDIRRIADELARRVGVTRTVSLVASSSIEAPVVVGWRTPRVLIPIAALPRLSRGEISAVLAHELAHVRRRDYAVNLLQSFGEVPLFFSPAVAWMARCVREAREFCCDDEAVARVGNRRHYVEALVSLAHVQAGLRLHSGVGISGPRLATRVRRLLQEESMPRLNLVRIVTLAGVLGLTAVTGVQVSAVSELRLPRQSDTTVYKISDPGVKAPAVLHEVKPAYTDDARNRRVEGTVELEEVITATGTVRDDVRVVKSIDAGLDAEAIKAAKQWRFRPATKDGKPVNVMAQLEMTFTLK